MNIPTPENNWQKSLDHIDLLGKFVKPRDVTQVLGWRYLKFTIKEKPRDAIDRFIRDGALIGCTVEEILNGVFTVPQLQKLSKERELPIKGNKGDLIKHLITNDPKGMIELTNRFSFMKCSESGLRLVDQYELTRPELIKLAKQQSYNALLDSKVNEAFNIFDTYQRRFTDSRYPEPGSIIKELEFVQSSHPRALGNISLEDLRSLRAAVSMSILWEGESPINWLPTSFHTHLKSHEVCANYLKQNAKIRRDLARFLQYHKRVQVSFYRRDGKSCDLCMALNGKVIDVKTFPDLPFEGCTSNVGCDCNIRIPDEDDYDSDYQDFSDDVSTDYSEETLLFQFENSDSDVEENEFAPKVESPPEDEVIDFEITATGDDLSEGAGFIIIFRDGSKFEFYYKHPRHVAYDNAAKRFFEEVNELADKLRWNLDANG